MDPLGQSILCSDTEVRILDNYGKQFGLDELAVRILDKAGMQYAAGQQPILLRLPVNRCHGPQSAKHVGIYLDSGVLARELDKFFKDTLHWDAEEGMRFRVLVAAAMTFGCTLPLSATHGLWKLTTREYQARVAQQNPMYVMGEISRLQLEDAVKKYKAGTPHDFGTGGFGEMLEQEIKNYDQGFKDMMNAMKEKFFVTPASGQQHAASVNVGYGLSVCATCGKKRSEDGKKDLLMCANCKDRFYCSSVCQKAHWKAHKPICMLPKEQLEHFLKAVPTDFGADVDMWGKKRAGE